MFFVLFNKKSFFIGTFNFKFNFVNRLHIVFNYQTLKYTFIFQLSKQAIKDYNRGRVYLSDLAKRKQIPVFEDITESIQCTIEKLNLLK